MIGINGSIEDRINIYIAAKYSIHMNNYICLYCICPFKMTCLTCTTMQGSHCLYAYSCVLYFTPHLCMYTYTHGLAWSI